MNGKKAKLLRRFSRETNRSYDMIKRNYTQDSIIGKTIGSQKVIILLEHLERKEDTTNGK